MMLRLVRKSFFDKLSDGLDFFVTCLGFSVIHQGGSLRSSRAMAPRPILSRAPN
jgi:hypothetical protein